MGPLFVRCFCVFAAIGGVLKIETSEGTDVFSSSNFFAAAAMTTLRTASVTHNDEKKEAALPSPNTSCRLPVRLLLEQHDEENVCRKSQATKRRRKRQSITANIIQPHLRHQNASKATTGGGAAPITWDWQVVQPLDYTPLSSIVIDSENCRRWVQHNDEKPAPPIELELCWMGRKVVLELTSRNRRSCVADRGRGGAKKRQNMKWDSNTFLMNEIAVDVFGSDSIRPVYTKATHAGWSKGYSDLLLNRIAPQPDEPLLRASGVFGASGVFFGEVTSYRWDQPLPTLNDPIYTDAGGIVPSGSVQRHLRFHALYHIRNVSSIRIVGQNQRSPFGGAQTNVHSVIVRVKNELPFCR